MEDIVVLNSDPERRFAPPGPGATATAGRSSAPVKNGVDVHVDAELDRQLSSIPDKLAFKIGEVADLVGVKAYVLRYWETEFEVLRPKKSKHNQRMYERRDVENLLLIKKLLYRDRFSIEGARSALKRLKKDNQRVQAIKTIAEHIEEARDLTLDLLDDIQAFRKLIKP